LVLELIEGRNLSKTLKRGDLSFHETIQYMSQISSILNFIHEKGIVH